uniref:protein-serine/threonine phosphatase n=1 Tax=Meloidogyne incognita TaxID=6306 RepID=A0A914LFX6_MELIC
MSDYLEENDIQLLKKAISEYFVSTDKSTSVRIRQRPLVVKSNIQDAKGDAISFVFESMIFRKFPLWASYMLAYDFIEKFYDELETIDPEKEADLWYSKVIGGFERYIREMNEGVHNLPAKPRDWDRYTISLCSQKNRKPKMEDRHIVLPSFSVIDSQFSSSDAFFAVFDGHNGSDCSAYASAHFLECLLDARSCGSSEESLLEDAFIRMDTRLTNRCLSENYKSGTTVSCIYLKDRKIAYMAWCGDSSIAVLKERRIETLSIPHKPDNPEERNRIEEAGGMVINVQGVPRLNGVLNLSRSLGDIRAKPMISSKPDLSTYPLSENEVDYMIFLSTDGIWDCLEEEQIFELVRIFVTEHSIKDFYLLADFIAAKAKEADSVDNMTLICVCLESLEEIWDTFAYKMEDRPLSKSC